MRPTGKGDVAIEDTSKRGPFIHLAGAMAEGTSGFIPGQEAAGQRQLVNSTAIPTDGPGDELEALGFKLGAIHGHDPMFRDCELPEGWKREGSEHAMWSYIVDEQGYRRIAIFYKAAFYDRSAHFRVEHVPQTKSQADAWEGIAPAHDALWHRSKARREGPNYIYQWRGRYGDDAPKGKNAYSDDGRRLEIEVAPDGAVVDRREFTVEPEEDRW